MPSDDHTADRHSKTCWICGTGVSAGQYGCPACQNLAALRDLRAAAMTAIAGSAPSAENPAAFQHLGFPALRQAQREALAHLIETHPAQAANLLEWGVTEAEWQRLQGTEGLQALDRGEKTPNQALAAEWCGMADELRRRGVLDESEEYFLKALDINRLDYRFYVGLSLTYLHTGQFDKASAYLRKSLPHAPEIGNFAYKSYSYRLLGRLAVCQGAYADAESLLRLAVECSPQYSDGYYDCAQYAALAGHAQVSLDCLAYVMALPFYCVLAQIQPAFAPIAQDLRHQFMTHVLADHVPTEYDAAVFELAKTWAVHGVDASAAALVQHVIERRPDYYDALSSATTPLRAFPGLERMQADLKSEMVKRATAVLNAVEADIQAAAELVAAARKAAESRNDDEAPLSSEVLHEHVVKKFEQSLELLATNDYAKLRTILSQSEEMRRQIQVAMSEAREEQRRYSEKTAKRERTTSIPVGTTLADALMTVGRILYWAVVFGIVGAVIGISIAFVHAISYTLFFGMIAVAGLLGLLAGIRIERIALTMLKHSLRRNSRRNHQ